jgi:hypothetical protein
MNCIIVIKSLWLICEKYPLIALKNALLPLKKTISGELMTEYPPLTALFEPVNDTMTSFNGIFITR